MKKSTPLHLSEFLVESVVKILGFSTIGLVVLIFFFFANLILVTLLLYSDFFKH